MDWTFLENEVSEILFISVSIVLCIWRSLMFCPTCEFGITSVVLVNIAAATFVSTCAMLLDGVRDSASGVMGGGRWITSSTSSGGACGVACLAKVVYLVLGEFHWICYRSFHLSWL